ncbi:hypothetical protein [Pseudomonas sp. dw_358]|uniref:hypothetical protein n=1 Tax=Pseudomonas sp. dw_358 TaxID=2720083 RepID=UPI001BD5023C|nr:hypothetical protein [Pseudomonas sp. dw_358]
MSALHSQAMTHVHAQLLQRLLGCFTPAQRASLQMLMQRLCIEAGGLPELERYKVLLACAGGKDSLQTLAFLRAAQLSFAQEHGATFTLRVATCRQAGISHAAFANVQRACSALFLQDDSRVELLLLDERRVSPLEPLPPLSENARLSQRMNLLVSGHLTGGDERVTFSNGCYLAMAGFYQRAISWAGGVDAVAVADEPRQLRHYLAWGMRAARQARGGEAPRNPLSIELLQALESLSDVYYQQLHGLHNGAGDGRPWRQVPRLPVEFLKLHSVIDGANPDHWHLLMDFLGFQFIGCGSGFTELDGASPVLLAHMRGLRAECLQGRNYRRGVHDYLRVLVPQMRARGMSRTLILRALHAWSGDEALGARRAEANEQADAAFGVTEEQLVCLLYAPFVEHGAALKAFVQRRYPQWLPGLAQLHGALQGQGGTEAAQGWLREVSGLPLVALRRLYHLQRVDLAGRRDLIAVMHASDPRRRQEQGAKLTGPALRDLIADRS